MSRADVRTERPDPPAGSDRGLLTVGLTALFVVLTGGAGAVLAATGTRLHLLGGVVLRGGFGISLTPQLALPVVLAVAGVLHGPAAAARLRWGALLAGSAAGSVLWAVALALVRHGGRLTEPLASRYEYPHDVDRVGDLAGFLATFVQHVPADSADPWTTHVSGHPPLALLAFVLLDRIGLGGLGWAAAMCIVAGAAAVPAVLTTVRAVADEAAARAVAPFAVLAPTALVIATSADALFAGVAAWGVAGLATAAARPPGPGADLRALAGGLLLGMALFLSFGLAALGPLALTVVLVRRGRAGCPAVLRVLGVAAGGVLVVLGSFAAAGYWWFEGLAAAADRVRSGPSYADRPLVFFLFANLAAAALVVGPAAVAGLGRLRREPLALVPLAAVAGMLVSGATGLVRGETERIWLPFSVWVLVACAYLPTASRQRWLAASAALAVLLEVLVRTEW